MIRMSKRVKLNHLRARNKSRPILKVHLIPNHLVIMILNVFSVWK
jgi:hypothetical protein